jgi:metallo-beta-lactamase class B
VTAGLMRAGMAVLGIALVSQPVGARPSVLHAGSIAEHQAQCAGKDGWSDPAPPIRIFGNVYDIGSCGITVLLIDGDAGAIVIDGAAAEAVPSIVANIERLGLRPGDVKLLLSTHEHGDHAAGLNELKRRTGATMVSTAAARAALESGVPAPDDPQRHGDAPEFRGVRVDRTVADGEVVRLGSLRLTAHTTPGHAPGSTSWSWRSCEGKVCHQLVYADSLSAISAGAYRFSDHPAYVSAFRASIAKIAALPCDLIVTPHPGASDLYERLAGKAPLADRGACASYAAAGRAALDRRLASEAGASGAR